MTLRYLEIFLALARTPNMRDAAAKLFISQAAVSSALRDFEAELGVSLFDRMGRGIRLNDKGRLLEERLAPLYNQLKNVLALVASDELAGRDPYRRVHYAVRFRAAASPVQFQDAAPSGRNRM